MATRFFLIGLLWFHALDYQFVIAQVTISQRLCLWPKVETQTVTCSADGSYLIFIKSIVVSRLLGGLSTCSEARARDAPEITDCRVTLGPKDSYYNDINRLCSDKPSCNINGNGNYAAYVGQSLCGLGFENSTIRNLATFTLQCYAAPTTAAATTASTRTTTTARLTTGTSPVSVSPVVPVPPTYPSSSTETRTSTDGAASGALVPTDDGTTKVIAGATVGGAIALLSIAILLVWLRRRGSLCRCTGLAGGKRGRFGGSGGMEPLYDDLLTDEKSGEEGGGRAVEQLRRMIAEEQSKQARSERKRKGSRAASSSSGKSSGRRHRHRSSRHVDANGDSDGGSTMHRRSHHRSAGRAGRSGTVSRHGGGHRHNRPHRHHKQQLRQHRSAGRRRARPSSTLGDGGDEWRQSTEVDDQSSIAEAELLSYVEAPAAAGEAATAADEWLDEVPPAAGEMTAEPSQSTKEALSKSRRPRRVRPRAEPKVHRPSADRAGKGGRSSRTHKSRDTADVTETTAHDESNTGDVLQSVDTVADAAASSRERRRERRRRRSGAAIGLDGAVSPSEGAPDAQDVANTRDSGSALTESIARSRDDDKSESTAISGRRDSGKHRDGTGRSPARRHCHATVGADATSSTTVDGERKRRGRSERAAKPASSRKERRRDGDGKRALAGSSRRRSANSGEAADAASDCEPAAARGHANDDEKRQRSKRRQRLKLPKEKSRSSQKRSVRRREYEIRRNGKFVSDSSASDSDAPAAHIQAGSHPSSELLEIMRVQQQQRQQQSEERGRRSKEKSSRSGARHRGKTADKKRRSSSHAAAAVTGGGGKLLHDSQLLTTEPAEVVPRKKDAELIKTDAGSAAAQKAVHAAASVHSVTKTAGDCTSNLGPEVTSGPALAVGQYQDLLAISTSSDGRDADALEVSERISQENVIVCSRSSTTVTCEVFRYETAPREDSVYECAIDANQNMTDGARCGICQRPGQSCECLKSVLVDGFNHGAVSPTLYALSA